MLKYAIILALSVFVLGCGEITPPTPDEIISRPLGGDPLDIGMSKDEVISIWGQPDVVNRIGISKGLGGTKKEEWIYYPTYSGVPVDKGYLSKTRYLYFDGNNLVRFHE